MSLTLGANLTNIAVQDPIEPCLRCQTLIPRNHGDLEGGETGEIAISLDYHLQDDFPAMANLLSGCSMCRVLRVGIRARVADAIVGGGDAAEGQQMTADKVDILLSRLNPSSMRVFGAERSGKLERLSWKDRGAYAEMNTAGGIYLTLELESPLTVSGIEVATQFSGRENLIVEMEIFEQPGSVIPRQRQHQSSEEYSPFGR